MNPARVQRRPTLQVTSREAVRLKDGGRPSRILAYLRESGGAADFEIERALNESHEATSGDRRGLVKRGLVYASDERRMTPHGCEAIVWKCGNGPSLAPFVRPNADPMQLELGVREC